jgi:diguanylate cyclase (GGDEF)-like protein
MAILLLDSGMWLVDGKQFLYALPLNWLITWFYYFFNCFVPFLWFEYTLSFFNYKIRLLQKHPRLVLLPVTLNFLCILLNLKYPIMFYIDQHNIYHRAEFFLLAPALSFIYLFSALLVSFCNNKITENKAQKQESSLMIQILILPICGAFVQILLYGISLIWICVVLSLLMIFINFQNQQISTDALTKINNRSQLDKYMQSLADHPSHKFSLTMIDVDRFKCINDTYGHIVGDKVLVAVAEILRSSSRNLYSFLCRYGGDEFIVVCEESALSHLLLMIETYTDAFNQARAYPFQLSLSLGSANFLGSQSNNMDAIIAEADALMYQNKMEKHSSPRI